MIISCLCRPAAVAELEAVLFRETGTLGVRRLQLERSIRQREQVTVQTVWGPVLGKRGWGAGAVETFAPEFDSCAAVAAGAGVALRDVYRAAEAAWTMAGGADRAEQTESHDHSHDHS
ncbi:MAG: nickel insertion protein, partial [Planctomycetaceae bacterium]